MNVVAWYHRISERGGGGVGLLKKCGWRSNLDKKLLLQAFCSPTKLEGARWLTQELRTRWWHLFSEEEKKGWGNMCSTNREKAQQSRGCVNVGN